MKRFLMALLFSSVSLFAAGTVRQSINQLGTTNTWVVAFTWTGDSGSGTVPITAAVLNPCQCQGYLFTTVETIPQSPAPTSGYSVAILDAGGADILDGAAASLSSSTTQAFAAAASATPLQGTFRLSITGQAVAGASGTVFVFLSKPGTVNLATLGRGSGGSTSSANWLTIANPPIVDMRRYDFAAQSPGGSLTGGVARTATLSPGPIGLVSGQRIYIAGGTGTAEAKPITASTCDGTGQASCTITFTPGNAHTGAWHIASASGGMEQAGNIAGFQGGVFVPPGLHVIHGTVTFDNAQTLFGAAGPLTSWIATDFVDGDVILMSGGGSVGGAHNLRITDSGTPRNSGSTLHLVGKSTGFVSDVLILDAFVGLELENWQGHVANVWIATANTSGATRAIYAHADGINVTGGTMSDLTLGIAGTLGYGLFIQGGDAGLQVSNLSGQGGAATVALNPNGLALNEILFTNLIMDGYAQAGFLAVGSTGSSNGITIVGARYSSPAANSIAFQFNSLYSHVKISEANGASILYDVDLMGTKSVDITNNRFASNGAGGNTNIFIETDGAVPTSDILIADNSLGFASGGGTTNPPVYSISVTAAAHDRIDVHGNTLRSALNWLSTGTYNIIRNNFDYSMTQPTCSSTLRGSLWYTASASGTTDLFNACVKTGADAYTWVQQINQTKGADITSANTITLTDRVHKVTGTTTIKTMNAPAGCIVTCQVTIIPTGALPWDNTGNILKPASTAVANTPLLFTWVAADSSWY